MKQVNKVKTIGERLKFYRETKNLTLDAVSEKLDISKELLEGWEKGTDEPDTPTVFRLGKIYGVSADMILFGGEGRAASQTMFPKSVEPQFSAFADWRVLTGALMVFCGIGGILLMIMRAIGEGYKAVGDMIAYCGTSLAVFAGLSLAGAFLALVTAAIRYKKHKKNNKK